MKWKNEGYQQLKISINLSNKQLQDDNFIPFLQTALDKYQIDPQYLELEITESITTDSEEVIPLLVAVKQLGVGLSIDDFGTGYSSLSALNYLPIDTLKIDRSFIQQMTTSQYGMDLIKSIIDIGKNMNLSVVAEGIETASHIQELKKLNCPIGQGYYFSRPISPTEFEQEFLKLEQAE